jgi:hypothetical protein
MLGRDDKGIEALVVPDRQRGEVLEQQLSNLRTTVRDGLISGARVNKLSLCCRLMHERTRSRDLPSSPASTKICDPLLTPQLNHLNNDLYPSMRLRPSYASHHEHQPSQCVLQHHHCWVWNWSDGALGGQRLIYLSRVAAPLFSVSVLVVSEHPGRWGLISVR